MRLPALPALVLVVALVAGCNGDDDPPPKLSRGDAAAISSARESLDDALDTTEALRTSNREARRLVRGLERRLEITPSLRSKLVSPISPGDEKAVADWREQLSDRQLSAASELVPSLVFTDQRRRPVGLDVRALGDFLRDAEDRPTRALHRPAAADVRIITGLLKDMNAGTKIVTLDNVTASRFLEQTAGDLRPVWRDLAGELARAREALG